MTTRRARDYSNSLCAPPLRAHNGSAGQIGQKCGWVMWVIAVKHLTHD